MGVTLKDVARAAGVNLSTASRSLNGAYGVHPRTRAAVEKAARQLNYRPNRVARGLATGRSQTMALVVSDIRNPFFAEVARGAEDAAYRLGCDLVLCNSDLNPDKQMAYIDSLLSKRVDGILMNSVGDLTRAQQEQLLHSGVPVVLLNRHSGRSRFSSVTPDNLEGGRIAAEYLVGLGHTRTAHLSGPRRHGNLRERTQGFVRYFQSHDLPAPLVSNGEHSFAGGYQMARKLLAATHEFTAIFAANDVLAFGAVRAAREAQVRIPEDLSIIGFDNLEISEILSPPLTTIHQPKYELGRSAMELLLEIVEKPGRGPEQRTIGVQLVERESCRKI